MNNFAPGDFLPDFQAVSSVDPTYHFGTLGGHRVLLVFIGSAGIEVGRRLCDGLLANRDWLKEQRVLPFLVTADPRDREENRLADVAGHCTIFWDFDRRIHRLYGLLAETAAGNVLRAGSFLIRQNLRLQAWVPATPVEPFTEHLRGAVATLPPPEPPRYVSGHAPVLQVPDVLNRAFCRHLIGLYEAEGGSESGFMRDVGGTTRGIWDGNFKRRRDCSIADESVRQRVRLALQRRIAPEIGKAFGLRMTRIERYLIGCYDETDQVFFRPHRDNVSKATAHRKFAISLNLNSEEYEGGALRFPEYGAHLYKPATGAAVVFSCSLLHEATPVTRGRRYVLPPFLYDERMAVVRQRNRRFLDDGPVTPTGEPVTAEDEASAS